MTPCLKYIFFSLPLTWQSYGTKRLNRFEIFPSYFQQRMTPITLVILVLLKGESWESLKRITEKGKELSWPPLIYVMIYYRLRMSSKAERISRVVVFRDRGKIPTQSSPHLTFCGAWVGEGGNCKAFTVN